MSGPTVEFDIIHVWMAAVFCALCLVCYRWTKQQPSPHIFFSEVKSLRMHGLQLKEQISKVPMWLLTLATISFLIAFIDPHYFAEKKNPPSGGGSHTNKTPSEGIAIYLVLDQSGSMQEKVTTVSADGSRLTISKVELLKEVTKKFVQGDLRSNLKGHEDDLIGIVEFARTPQVVAPLTLDHKFILDKLSKFSVVPNEEDDGTGIGYAIFKTANLIAATRHYAQDLQGAGKPAYDIKTNVIIIVTDGFQDPNALDEGNRLRTMGLPEAAAYAKSQNVGVYIVDVDPAMGSDEYAAQRRQMQQITELTGGKYYLMNPTTSLNKIYGEIESLEKSRLPIEALASSNFSKDQQPELYRRISLYPYFIAFGMFLLIISVILKTTWLRKIP
jgi:Ca-activated chloride channel homolog